MGALGLQALSIELLYWRNKKVTLHMYYKYLDSCMIPTCTYLVVPLPRRGFLIVLKCPESEVSFPRRRAHPPSRTPPPGPTTGLNEAGGSKFIPSFAPSRNSPIDAFRSSSSASFSFSLSLSLSLFSAFVELSLTYFSCHCLGLSREISSFVPTSSLSWPALKSSPVLRPLSDHLPVAFYEADLSPG